MQETYPQTFAKFYVIVGRKYMFHLHPRELRNHSLVYACGGFQGSRVCTSLHP